jgi:hypothetical protein
MFEDRATNVIRLSDHRPVAVTLERQYRISAQRLRRVALSYDPMTRSRLRRLARSYELRSDELAGQVIPVDACPALLTRAVGGDPAR